jgi:hypothetical protein
MTMTTVHAESLRVPGHPNAPTAIVRDGDVVRGA